MPLKETAPGLFAYVFITFITVIIWWLYEDGAKPTKTVPPRLSEASLRWQRLASVRVFSLRGATAPPRDLPAFHVAGTSRLPKTRLASAP